MRITELEIHNFRAIEYLHLEGLDGFVVIAGANGSGKTTILDALRLVKSSYVHDEASQWFGEFGIQTNQPLGIRRLLRDASKPGKVSAVFQLSDPEVEFLGPRLENIFAAIHYNGQQRGRVSVNGEAPLYPADMGTRQREQVTASVAPLVDRASKQLSSDGTFTASIEITWFPSVVAHENPLATAALACFAPGGLGEMDFHTSSRTYNRQGEGNINVRLGNNEEAQSRFLYGLQNKYQNLKTRLSEELVRAKLRGEGGSGAAPLEASIKHLFRTFFPDKAFRGIEVNQDTGDLRFDVELSTGERHDIEELSSGEKEIVYGYLWLRTATPPHSLVLIDEPELHLNPALVRDLPEFYQTYLGDALDAQVWIVTHSDAILRKAARTAGMKVFHVARASGDGSNQAASISTGDAIETAVIDLIGDLAAYRPHATIVLVEGASDTRFDVAVIRGLFPELATIFRPGSWLCCQAVTLRGVW